MISWHRFYDPQTGRYISADPIGLAGGMNLYAYVGGDPINWVDSSGLLRAGRNKPGVTRGGPIAGIDVYRKDSGPGSQINEGHEWIVYDNGENSVGYWPNRNQQVLRPDPAVSEGYEKNYHWSVLKKNTGTLKWGSGKGKECKCATEEEINSCLDSVPNPNWIRFDPYNNCRRFSRSSLSGCCLKKGDMNYTDYNVQPPSNIDILIDDLKGSSSN